MANKKGWDWDIGQWFTPPKSKTPWQAMTEGSSPSTWYGDMTQGWMPNLARILAGKKWDSRDEGQFKESERYGPILMEGSKYIPVVGQAMGIIGGAAGMGGRNTGFQGTDYGWGNVGPMMSGIGKGMSPANPWGGVMGTLNYDTTYDRSKDPRGKEFDFSSLLSVLGNYFGNQYGGGGGGYLGRNVGSNVGTQIGNNVYGDREMGYSFNPSWQNSLASIMNRR